MACCRWGAQMFQSFNVVEASKPYDQEIQRAMDDNGKTLDYFIAQNDNSRR